MICVCCWVGRLVCYSCRLLLLLCFRFVRRLFMFCLCCMFRVWVLFSLVCRRLFLAFRVFRCDCILVIVWFVRICFMMVVRVSLFSLIWWFFGFVLGIMGLGFGLVFCCVLGFSLGVGFFGLFLGFVIGLFFWLIRLFLVILWLVSLIVVFSFLILLLGSPNRSRSLVRRFLIFCFIFVIFCIWVVVNRLVVWFLGSVEM